MVCGDSELGLGEIYTLSRVNKSFHDSYLQDLRRRLNDNQDPLPDAILLDIPELVDDILSLTGEYPTRALTIALRDNSPKTIEWCLDLVSVGEFIDSYHRSGCCLSERALEHPSVFQSCMVWLVVERLWGSGFELSIYPELSSNPELLDELASRDLIDGDLMQAVRAVLPYAIHPLDRDFLLSYTMSRSSIQPG